MAMQQRRWVSYIFRYRNYERCEVAGFIKVQRISNKSTDVTRIRMGLRMCKDYPCECTAYLLLHGQARPFTTIHFMENERDAILTSVELPWNDPLGDGAAFPEYEGVFFLCDDGEQLAGIWLTEHYDLRQVQVAKVIKGEPAGTDVIRSGMEGEKSLEAAVRVEMTKPEASVREAGSMEITRSEDESASPESRDVEELQSEDEAAVEPTEIPKIQIPVSQPVIEEVREKDSNSCSEMLSTYPKLPLFAGSQILDGVKIVPQDIGKLDMANWKLGVNSFLSHGYYKYQYLMLGKVRMNKAEAYVIGVPGIFTNKERYLANMFGFRIFIPVKKTKIMTGNFGYWISEIVG